MKFEVYNDQKPFDTQYLSLHKNNFTGEIELHIGDSDEAGSCCTILSITTEGTVRLWDYICDCHGLSLDSDGFVIVEKDETY